MLEGPWVSSLLNFIHKIDAVMSDWGTSCTQLIRFGVVGTASNLLLYLIYLSLVSFGIDSKGAVTILYVLGLSATFLFNKRWSFSHKGLLGESMKRYIVLYATLYICNIGILFLLVDILELAHAFVQAGVILFYIPIVFLGQRFWVFSPQLDNRS